MTFKALKKFIAILFAAVLLAVPFSASAAQNTAFMGGIGKDFMCFFGRESAKDKLGRAEVMEEMSFDEANSVEALEDSAVIYLENYYISLRAEQYNLLMDSWLPVDFVHEGYSVQINHLLPGTFYKIRLTCVGKSIGEYSFFTKPLGLESLQLKVNEEKRIELNWTNPKGMLTEIFKRVEGDRLYYIGATRDGAYLDYDVHQGKGYSYKLRFVCKNQEAVSYSEFTKAATFVEEDINDVINSNGYIIIRQTDENNRTIPYPYNDNGKTIGTSGCGVCSSLMVLRNTTAFKPTLEAYTKELIEAGCRESYGSDMLKIAKYLKQKYHMDYTVTKDPEKLKAHLDKGYMATAHVGTNRLFTTITGHFVTVAGYIKSDGGDKAIILDPAFSRNKYSDLRRVEAGIEYTDDGIVSAPFETLLDDCKGEYFVLFTP